MCSWQGFTLLLEFILLSDLTVATRTTEVWQEILQLHVFGYRAELGFSLQTLRLAFTLTFYYRIVYLLLSSIALMKSIGLTSESLKTLRLRAIKIFPDPNSMRCFLTSHKAKVHASSLTVIRQNHNLCTLPPVCILFRPTFNAIIAFPDTTEW